MAPNARHPRRGGAVAIAVLAIAVGAIGLAGCGGSGKPSAGFGSSGQAAGIRLANCMRAHGVPSFPDPGAGGAVQLNRGSGVDPASPAFRSAQNACSSLLPGGAARGPVSAARKLAMLNLARCMRSHGLTTFPDPTSTPPSPGSGFGLAFGAPGAFIAIPQALVQSPAFKQAAAACGFPGAGGRAAKTAPVG